MDIAATRGYLNMRFLETRKKEFKKVRDYLAEHKEYEDYRHSYGWQKTEIETAEKIIFSNE